VNPADLRRLLFVFAVLELVLAALMMFVFHNVVIGASQVAISMSLIAVAVSSGKKKSNG